MISQEKEMRRAVTYLSLTFAAGGLGGLINGLAAWLLGAYGLTAAAGVAIAPELTPPMLYHRVVWGGIWAVLFLLPLMQKRLWLAGLVYSLGPTLVQLLVVFPLKADKGMFGLDLGSATPAFVVLLNAIWGLAAAAWLAAAGFGRRSGSARDSRSK